MYFQLFPRLFRLKNTFSSTAIFIKSFSQNSKNIKHSYIDCKHSRCNRGNLSRTCRALKVQMSFSAPNSHIIGRNSRKRASIRPSKKISPLISLKLWYKRSPKRHARDSETTAVKSYSSSKLSHNDMRFKMRAQNGSQKWTLSAPRDRQKSWNQPKTPGIDRRDIYLSFKKNRSKKSIF